MDLAASLRAGGLRSAIPSRNTSNSTRDGIARANFLYFESKVRVLNVAPVKILGFLYTLGMKPKESASIHPSRLSISTYPAIFGMPLIAASSASASSWLFTENFTVMVVVFGGSSFFAG